MEKGAFSILGFCAWAGIGRSKAYDEIASGHIKALKVGKRTLIATAEAQRWLESLEPAEIGRADRPSSGLPISRVRSRHMNEQELKSLRHVIQFLWRDEQKNFEECKLNDGKALDHHIFPHLETLDCFLTREQAADAVV